MELVADSNLKRTENSRELAEPLKLESGKMLDRVHIAYETYGQLNRSKDNAILVCHALTGNAHLAGEADNLKTVEALKSMDKKGEMGWWDSITGPGKLLNSNKYFIISSNILGSCYGSSGPSSINPDTGEKYTMNFPQITIRDMVDAQYQLIKELGISRLFMVIGGSLGGMQALEWAISYPEMVGRLVPIATSARHSDWSIALNHLGRQAIMNDPEWNEGRYSRQPVNGLSLARKVGMISYRTDSSFNARFSNTRVKGGEDLFDDANIFQVENYLNYQGEKLVNRFDANAYLYLTRAMDLHDVGRNRGGMREALSTIRAKTMCIGIDSDMLYPASEQREIASAISLAEYKEVRSIHGHDAFLIEYEQLIELIKPFMEE